MRTKKADFPRFGRENLASNRWMNHVNWLSNLTHSRAKERSWGILIDKVIVEATTHCSSLKVTARIRSNWNFKRVKCVRRGHECTIAPKKADRWIAYKAKPRAKQKMIKFMSRVLSENNLRELKRRQIKHEEKIRLEEKWTRSWAKLGAIDGLHLRWREKVNKTIQPTDV